MVWTHHQMNLWCRGPESNRYDLNDRRILSPVRLPVPPPRLMALRVGLEPTTYRLTAGCSTIELPKTINLIGFISNIIQKKNLLPGNFLLSQVVTNQVPSALRGLTSVFGMGTGVSLLLSSPDEPSCIYNRFWSSLRPISIS